MLKWCLYACVCVCSCAGSFQSGVPSWRLGSEWSVISRESADWWWPDAWRNISSSVSEGNLHAVDTGWENCCHKYLVIRTLEIGWFRVRLCWHRSPVFITWHFWCMSPSVFRILKMGCCCAEHLRSQKLFAKRHSVQTKKDFLLLMCYIPNVAKRSTWHQCIYWRPTDHRPTSNLG